MNSVTID